MARPVITIGGTDHTTEVYRAESGPSLTMTYDIGALGSCAFSTHDLDSTASAYRPTLRQTVVVTVGGVTYFSGRITRLLDEPLNGTGTGTLTHVTAKSDAELLERTLLAATYATGQTLKQLVDDIIGTKLQAGIATSGGDPVITVDAGMATGPTFEALTFNYVPYRDAIDRLATTSGYVWRITPAKVLEMFTAGTKTAAFLLTAANKGTIGPVTWEQVDSGYVNWQEVVYNGGITSANDSTDYNANGIYQRLAQASDYADADAAADYGAGLLAQGKLTDSKRVTVQTRQQPLELPGTVITLTFANRLISGAHLINRVRITDRSLSGDLVHEYQCGEGSVQQWSATDRLKGQLGGRTGVTISGGSLVTLPPGLAEPVAPSYFLGGSGVEAVRDAGPTWVAASPMRVVATKTSGTVRCRVRALEAGVSVQPRLRDITAGATAGTGAVTTATAWTADSFAVTLTVGNVYEFQLLPGTANKDVAGIGYLE